jgi:hypothetical protein
VRSNMFMPALIKSGLATSVLLLAGGAAFGQTVAVTPSGTVDVGASLTTPSLTLTGPIDAGFTVTGVAPPFSVVDVNGCAAAGVAAAASCTMNVTFSPVATGLFTDTVTVNATSGGVALTTPLTTTLRGTGASGLTVTATASGNVDVGASLTTLALTLTADSSSVIDAGSVSVTGVTAPFTVDTTNCTNGAAASSSCTMNVTFAPTGTGPFTDTVTVSATSHGASEGALSANLSGRGTVPAVTPANPVVFTDLGPGVPSTRTVTVSLNNAAETVLFTFNAALSSSTPYAVTGGTCLATPSIALGGVNPTSCTIIVTYTPPAGVDPSASLTVGYAFGTPATTQLVAKLDLVDQNPAAGGVPAGGTVEVELTSVATSVTLNDGSTVPMWGYQCGANSLACTALNPALPPRGNTSAAWSPVVITAMAGQSLAIDLTNNLSFAANSNKIPTSIVIVGQLGGGLGTSPKRTPSPDHSQAQVNVTWPIAGNGAGTGTPPAQGDRVQSFGTEVPAGTTTRLVWNNLRPGTYLIESGTHPSIQGPMGLYGILVVTTAPGATAGTAYPANGANPAVNYSAEVPLLMSEIDPVQNNAVSTAVNTAGFLESNVWSGQPGRCGNPGSPVGVINTCYPPAVNYTPLYYLFNGVAFNKTNVAGSLFPAVPGTASAPITGTVLVRLVNAGLRMHVPAIVGSQTGVAVSPAVPPTGFTLIAEDGNPLPGVPRVQSEVFMAAGKTYDVMINVPSCTTAVPPATCPALPIYDRELSLSGNAIARDAGMLAYIGVNGAAQPRTAQTVAAVARPDTYNSVVAGNTIVVSDPTKGVIANDTNVYGVKVVGAVPAGLTLNTDGTFTYSGGVPTTFLYCGNGATSGPACAKVTLGAATIEAAGGITVNPDNYTAAVGPVSTTVAYLSVKSPGVLANDSDAAGYPLTVNGATLAAPLSVTLSGPGTGTAIVSPDGSFNATVTAPGAYTFTYSAQNSQGTVSASTTTVTLTFPAASGLVVNVVDGTTPPPTGTNCTTASTTAGCITDYRWIIEEDRTFYVDPNCTTNPQPAGCPTFGPVNTATGTAQVPTFGTNFHTSYMPVVATGCTGTLSCESGQSLLGTNAVCDVGNGVCRTTATQQTPVLPSQVNLDPTKRYYLSVLPGDAATPFETGSGNGGVITGTGHGMGGAPIAAAVKCGTTGTTIMCTSVSSSGATLTCSPTAPAVTCVPTGTTIAPVTVLAQPTPFPPSKLSVFVFEDDFPLNGEQDGGGGVDVLSPQEPGLGGFNITIMDDAGGPGDPTGQVDYDMFNQPLSNSLAGTIDPATGKDACPIGTNPNGGVGVTGTIVTCPKYESDGKTLSPLAGQAIVANMMPGRYGIVATPAADRIARGEEWLQTNTLDGQKAHDSFLRIGEPSFFQEYGPAGFHVTIGFANPAIINARLPGVCNGNDPFLLGATNCHNTITGKVTTERMSRTPDERLYSSGDRSSFAFTQCYVSVGDSDGEDFAFTKCASDGTFTISGLPDGDWRVTTFDQWNDQLVDGLSTPVRLAGGATLNMGEIAANQWQANFMTRTFLDQNKDGVSQGTEPGLALVKTNVRFRDGSFSNRNNTDLNGYAAFNEEFPLFNWYVIETDVTRYKNTGTHVVYDAGGPADNTPCGNSASPPTAPCGTSNIGNHLANTVEQVSVPVNLRVPGAVYCKDADCSTHPTGIAGGPAGSDPPSSCTTSPTDGTTTCSTTLSTGRIDPPWVLTEAWQGFSGQNNFLEFGKTPYAPGENGGIRGHVVYSSTRPFDDPQFGTQNVWEPLVPNVTMNLYKQSTAPDGSTSLTLVDHTQTSSWDAWAQGFHLAADGVTKIPNMNCPGQLPAPTSGAAGDLFFFSIFNQPNYLDWYNAQHGGPAYTSLPNNSQFKCYDGMHNWNQLQPAPYDGMYQFPSVTGLDPTTGKPTGTNCTICNAANGGLNPDTSDPYRSGTPMLPAGKYVVEVVVPPGYELVKEEDKNILIGDNFIGPATVEFPGLGSAIYIIPDQAQVGAAYNANSTQNPTTSLGRVQNLTSHEGDTPTVDTFWPCAGDMRIVPDYISLYPQSAEVAPFAGASRPLCDRKLVTLDDQSSSQAEFFVFTSTHAAAHFTGVITDDFTSEFDPFSPQFGEKFSPPNLPVSIKDWKGNETNRVYSDHWGAFDGLSYSTWEVNPPNPTGYSPTMMETCMNDPGTGPTPDPLFNPAYSNFCYELPFMPGATQYMDTPVTPTSAFASAGYDNPDCEYPDLTPAVSEVDGGTGIGPYVSGAGQLLHIYSLANQTVANYGYAGPQATTAPFNQKTITRHYGFGSATGSVALVGSDGVAHPLTGVSWSDTVITGTVPTGVPNCQVQQQLQYGGSTAQCGELVITTAPSATHPNGQQSIDTVTVTIGGKAPKHIPATASIQTAIDLAMPGDMLMIDPASQASAAGPGQAAIHQEMLLMWKPIRLQGVGAVSSVLNGNTHPVGKLDPWRREVNCLFGLAINGQANTDLGPNPALIGSNPYDSTGNYSCPLAVNGTETAKFSATTSKLNYYSGTSSNPQVDRLPLEAVIGWDATQNGNLAELLQEPSLMGALEGATVTVLSKGVLYPAGSDPFGAGATNAGVYPAGTTLLSASNCGANTATAKNPYPSNFYCNPSSIDGVTVTNSSQGGGGIFVHAWGHNIQIANNRVRNNSGTLSGGISVGQGEYPPPYTAGGTNLDPGSCQTNTFLLPAGTQLQYCLDVNVNMHHNSITLNSSTGDELFSATPAGAGGVSICNGSDYYKFNYNWVCGNLSTGDGGGVGHIGFSYNGDIEHNTIVFNQSTNPTIPANGGGLLIMGAPDVDQTCGITTDQDCVSVPPVGPADGVGPGLVINANLIMGNAADSGSGGGLRLQGVNGTDVLTFPTNPTRLFGGDNWYRVMVTNNIIANNVAGWDGAGVSLQDALVVDFINNTIVSNDTTASSGVLFNTLGAPLASSQGPKCTVNCGTQSLPQPAGLVSIQNSTNLTANLPAQIRCPVGHGNTDLITTNGACRQYSVPELYNDVFWDNRAYDIGVGTLGTGPVNQQNQVALYTMAGAQAPNQPQADATLPNGAGTIITGGTGACTTATYWDIGVRGDTGPANHKGSTIGTTVTALAPTYSVLTSLDSYYSAAALHNTASNPTFLSQYCNGSRVPPEIAAVGGGLGWQVPPGISDATVPNPVFNLTPAATVDEGNNWINLAWGPLSLTNPTAQGLDTYVTANYGGGPALGSYVPTSSSSTIDYVPSTAPTYAAAPSTDFFGNLRKGNSHVDAGAVEYVPVAGAVVAVTPTSLTFSAVAGSTSPAQTLTVQNTGGASMTGLTVAVTAPFGRAGGSCGATLTSGASCTINVVFSPASTATGTLTGSVTISGSVAVTGSPVSLTGNAAAATHTATVSPNPLAFDSWATGTTSNARTLTVTNTGNSPLAGGTFTFGGGTPQPFSRGGGGAGGSCGATLAVGATCTYNVVFAPGTAAAFSRTLTVAYTGGATVTGSPVTLTGTGVAARATVSITPNPLTISVAAGVTTGTGTVTLTNTAPAGGASFTVTAVNVTGAGLGGTGGVWFFNTVVGSNTCTTLAPGATCTVGVRFTDMGRIAPLPVTHTGAIAFIDNAAGSPQTGVLTGIGN